MHKQHVKIVTDQRNVRNLYVLSLKIESLEIFLQSTDIARVNVYEQPSTRYMQMYKTNERNGKRYWFRQTN